MRIKCMYARHTKRQSKDNNKKDNCQFQSSEVIGSDDDTDKEAGEMGVATPGRDANLQEGVGCVTYSVNIIDLELLFASDIFVILKSKSTNFNKSKVSHFVYIYPAITF